MGLDQYIRRLTPGETHVEEFKNAGGECVYRYEHEFVEVAYFRKVNFLHKWVEDNLNEGIMTNCEDIPFHMEAMAGLAATCRKVLTTPDLGPLLLPTMPRFFFGSTDYDDWYVKDVEAVCTALEGILVHERTVANPPGSGQYVYASSW